MRYILAVLTAAVTLNASPLPQAVTAAVSPSDSSPPGCTRSRSGTFGIAAMNVSSGSNIPAKRQESQSSMYRMAPVSGIIDGQIQAGMHTVTMMPVSQIADGQPQAPTGLPKAPVSECEAQPQVLAATSTSATQSQASTAPSSITASSVPTDGSTDTTNSSTTLVACRDPGTLELTLIDGVLQDSENRTGYIASNYQFQFDGPPQSGALFTSGFSICANGSLALGGSNIFYQCLSGDFYNLYDRYWAAQCSPVTIETLVLQDCD